MKAGAEVDCVDAWDDGQATAAPLAGELELSIAELSADALRFFEMHRFVFVERRPADEGPAAAPPA